MNDKLQCFTCKKYKQLDAFKDNKRHYQIKWYKGKCFSCKTCEKKKVLRTLKAIRFNFELKKFEIHEFKNINQALKFLKND